MPQIFHPSLSRALIVAALHSLLHSTLAFSSLVALSFFSSQSSLFLVIYSKTSIATLSKLIRGEKGGKRLTESPYYPGQDKQRNEPY